MVAEEGVAVHLGLADGADLGLAAQLNGLFLDFFLGSFFSGGRLILDDLLFFLRLAGGALLGSHVGFQLLDGLFHLSHGVDVFINQGLVFLASLMQAVDHQFSFSRLHKADPVLGVDMSSTGEVGCIGDDFHEALLNSMIAVGFKIPTKSVMFSSGATKSKVDLLEASRMLAEKGYEIYATAGTATFLNAHGVNTTPVYWPDEKPDAENNVMKMIAEHKFDLIVNIPKNHTKRELTNGYKIRRGAIDHNIPLITNARLASAFIEAFCEMSEKDIQIKSWQDYK